MSFRNWFCRHDSLRRKSSRPSVKLCLEKLEDRLAPAVIAVTTTADKSALDGHVSLREAILSINQGSNFNADVVATGTYGSSDTITVPAGRYNLGLGEFLISKPVTINGAGSAKSIFDGRAKDRVFKIEFRNLGGVTLAGLTIQNGLPKDTEGGGGILDKLGGTGTPTLTLDDCRVIHNRTTSPENGGGILARTGEPLILKNSTVSNNRASKDGFNSAGGGGIADFGGDVTLTNCHVDNNFAAGGENGGGIDSEGGDVSLTDCTVNGNKATGTSSSKFGKSEGGGGINSEGGDVTLVRTHVDHNQSAGKEDGGAIDSEGGDVSLTDSTLQCNTASGAGSDSEGGGGINSEGGDVTLVNSHVDHNTTKGIKEGGGINSEGGNVNLTDSSVIDNEALASGKGSEGGGGINSEEGHVTLNNSTVSCNFAAGNLGGGGISTLEAFDEDGEIFINGGLVTASNNSQLYRNKATFDGGAIATDNADLSGTTITRNKAADGGGLLLRKTSSTITDSVIAGNTGSPDPNIHGTFTDQGGNTIGPKPPVEPPPCPPGCAEMTLSTAVFFPFRPNFRRPSANVFGWVRITNNGADIAGSFTVGLSLPGVGIRPLGATVEGVMVSASIGSSGGTRTITINGLKHGQCEAIFVNFTYPAFLSLDRIRKLLRYDFS